jgi:hypothetical protein
MKKLAVGTPLMPIFHIAENKKNHLVRLPPANVLIASWILNLSDSHHSFCRSDLLLE